MAITRILQRFTIKSGTRNFSQKPNFGLLFDIDGVIVRGNQVLPAAIEGFQRLVDSNGKFKVPTVFVTNSGNALRSERAADLSKWLGIEISTEQVILAHSPLTMFTEFHDKNVFISGQGRTKEIALELGFKNIVTMNELVQNFPSLDYIDKAKRNPQCGPIDKNFRPIEGIVLLSEPINWETTLQLVVDLLLTNGMPTYLPKENLYPHIPILTCNMDLLWVSEAPIPRYGHGALLTCLEALYKKITGNKLLYTALIGKPSLLTYFFATQKLIHHAKSIGANEDLKTVYAFGDNINTDIYGANMYNEFLSGMTDLKTKSSIEHQLVIENEKNAPSLKHCVSMLVETGVYQPNSSFSPHHSARDYMPLREELCEPKCVSKDVGKAICEALEKEQFQ